MTPAIPLALPILLVGPEAAALGPRLELTGYTSLVADDFAVKPLLAGLADRDPPAAVILSPLLTRLRLHLELGRRGSLDRVDPTADPLLAPRAGTKDAAPELDLRLADLRLVPASAKVWRGSRLIELTAREYQLLLFFLRHPGEVISRDKILQLVWGHSESGGSNVIDVYVRYLRQKLEAGGEGRLLQTVRGQGYALAERLPTPQPEQP